MIMDCNKLADLLEASARALRELSLEVDRVNKIIGQEHGTKIDMHCGLSVRARKVCLRMGIEYIEQLSLKSVDDFVYAKNCGKHTVREIVALAAERQIKMQPSASDVYYRVEPD